MLQPEPPKRPPIVLAIGGHDPSGGAGIQADIETISALGGHAVTAVTALTVQDTVNVRSMHPVDASILREQLKCVLSDVPVDVIKIGLLGSVSAVETIAEVLAEAPGIPVVLDPVLAAGGGTELSDTELRDAIRVLMLPSVLLMTPNTLEAERLTGEKAPEQASARLQEFGCGHVLVSGGHEAGDEVVNRYFGPEGSVDSWRWPRLDGEFHGSGCTLASACAVLLARGLPMKLALRLGQAFTQDALAQAQAVGRGQLLPRRVLPQATVA